MAAMGEKTTAQSESTPDASTSQPLAQEGVFREMLAQSAQRREALRAKALRKERALFNVIKNAGLAVRGPQDWTSAMRRAAIFAFMRSCLSPRPLLFAALSVGGLAATLATALLAWQANTFLDEQNQKMELQSHLDIASVYANYAQRNAQLLESAQPLLNEIQKSKALDPKANLTTPQRAQLSALLSSFQPLPAFTSVLAGALPHRLEDPENSESAASDRGALYNLLESLLGHPEKSGYQRSLDELPIPIPSGEPRSVERGQIIFTLYSFGVKDFENLNLQDADLSGIDLSGADLSGTNLSRANLSHAILSGARLVSAVLHSANLSSAELNNNADLSNANLYHTRLDYSLLKGANLAGAFLDDASLEGANLSNANLLGAQINRANLKKAQFVGARLLHANLIEADLSGARFNGADLKGADFSEANLSNAILAKADLSNAILTKTNLSPANLTNAILRNTDIAGARLGSARLSEEHLFESTCGTPATLPENYAGLRFRACDS